MNVTYTQTKPVDSPRKVYKGVLQGGSSSAMSYIFYVASILQNLPPQITALQFADDIALYIKSSKPHNSVKILEKAVETISFNLLELGLELAP